jgi:hypothetical protein
MSHLTTSSERARALAYSAAYRRSSTRTELSTLCSRRTFPYAFGFMHSGPHFDNPLTDLVESVAPLECGHCRKCGLNKAGAKLRGKS